MSNYTPTECYLNNLAPTGRKAVISLIKSVKNTLLLNEKLAVLPLHKLSFEQLSTLKQSLVLNNKSARTIHLTFQVIKAIAKVAAIAAPINNTHISFLSVIMKAKTTPGRVA